MFNYLRLLRVSYLRHKLSTTEAQIYPISVGLGLNRRDNLFVQPEHCPKASCHKALPQIAIKYLDRKLRDFNIDIAEATDADGAYWR